MDNDIILMQRASDGDLESFTKLVSKYQRRFYIFFLRSTGSKEDAEDLTQILFVKLYKSAPDYSPRSSFKTFIYRIARNLAVSFSRKRKKRDSIRSLNDMSDDGYGFKDRSYDSNPSSFVEKGELVDRYEDALRDLPHEWRLAVELRAGQGLSYREISEILEKSISAVESILFRARKRLAAELSVFLKDGGG